MLLCFVEDEFYIREGVLSSVDWQALHIDRVEAASDGKAGAALLSMRPDILLTDIRLPYFSGLELANLAKAANADCEVIIISSYSNKEYLFQAISLSAVAYVEKPIDISELSSAISLAVDRRKRSLLFRSQESDTSLSGDVLTDISSKPISHTSRIILRQHRTEK